MHRRIKDYEICGRQITLTELQKADFFITFFSGSARHFFFDKCKDEMTFTQLADVRIRECDCGAKRVTVQSELVTRTIEPFMSDRETNDDTTALKNLWST